MDDFIKLARNMNDVEILNLYRNLYYAEPSNTEHGILARAINTILPKYIQMASKKNY